MTADNRTKRIAIIGGGAAGFFLAVNLKEMSPLSEVCIFEKSRKILSKVEISGGGRCNCTNSFEDVRDMKTVYPRGDKLMKRLFKEFDNHDAYKWFEEHGVPLVTQDDQCVFPQSQDSHSIINCFTAHAHKYGIRTERSCPCTSIEPAPEGGYILSFAKEDGASIRKHFDKVAITTGGSPLRKGLDWLERLGHSIVDPVPSLFTFNIKSAELRHLMGTVVENATASIPATKFRATGPLLITHWGMSGPAVLKLSSYAARHLSDNSYKSPLAVNWTGEGDTNKVIDHIAETAEESSNKQLSSVRPYNIPQRLWEYLIGKCELKREKRWGELGKKGVNRIANILTNDTYVIEGKSAFREEFVTCGGVSLTSVNMSTMESKTCPGMFFAGEVLDIDGITGGFNFQAAWTTAYRAAKSMAVGGVDDDYD